jgi:Tol biopolymer transport system component
VAPVRNVVVYAKPSTLSRIAYSTAPETSWRARLDGSHTERLTSGDDPALSPDGRWIAFSRGGDLLLMPAAGGAAKVIYTFSGPYADTGLGYAPTWAPDSRHLAFVTTDGLIVLDPLSHALHVLPQRADPWFAFSPNSHKIAYSVSDRTGADVYVGSVLGGKPARLTYDHKSFAPAWGKPGIAVFRYAPRARGDIWLTSDWRTHRFRRLTHRNAAAVPVFFSADGKELLAANPPTHSGRLWAVDVGTGAERPVTPWVGGLVAQGLSAGGSAVLAAIGCAANGAPYGEVETIPFAGGKPHVIARGPCGASWDAR